MSMLQASVYRKSLRLQRVPKGKATNLMNVDPITVHLPPLSPRFDQLLDRTCYLIIARR
jgi:hypothetical protein